MCCPLITYPSTFANAIGNPSAALLATALWIGTLHQDMKGTLTKPPPAPTRPDRNPITPPAATWPAAPGRWRVGAGFLSRNICVAEKLTNRAKKIARKAPLSNANTPRLAPRPPSTMPGASRRTMSQRTAPRRWWARTLEIDVNTMVAIEVAIAIFTARSGATCCVPSMWVMKGIINMRRPMPSRPARKPVTRPSTPSSTISRGSSMVQGRWEGENAAPARPARKWLHIKRHMKPGLKPHMNPRARAPGRRCKSLRRPLRRLEATGSARICALPGHEAHRFHGVQPFAGRHTGRRRSRGRVRWQGYEGVCEYHQALIPNRGFRWARAARRWVHLTRDDHAHRAMYQARAR